MGCVSGRVDEGRKKGNTHLTGMNPNRLLIPMVRRKSVLRQSKKQALKGPRVPEGGVVASEEGARGEVEAPACHGTVRSQVVTRGRAATQNARAGPLAIPLECREPLMAHR
jgi:hypothetical protein